MITRHISLIQFCVSCHSSLMVIPRSQVHDISSYKKIMLILPFAKNEEQPHREDVLRETPLVDNINTDSYSSSGSSTKKFDPFTPNDSFDLSLRSGASAYSTSSTLLDDIWNDNMTIFPYFLVYPRLRTKEEKWDTRCILTVVTINIFMD